MISSMSKTLSLGLALLSIAPTGAFAHLTVYTKANYGFNVTQGTFAPLDNRPMVPLMNRPFLNDLPNAVGWWHHGMQDYPPNDGDGACFVV